LIPHGDRQGCSIILEKPLRGTVPLIALDEGCPSHS
jgi:hypothetical protein